jgi:hypothetical protein
MADQTVASLSTTQGLVQDLNFSRRDRQVLRDLAQQAAELVARPIEAEKRDLWYRHNALEPTRPVVFCDPENGWNEIITEDQIVCENELAQSWEMTLRKEIFWGTIMGDDRVVEPFFNVPYTYTDSGWGLEKVNHKVMADGSYAWDAPLKDYERDFEKLHFPEITVDYETTHKVVDLAQEVVGDFLPVRLKGVWWWTLGMTWTLIDLRGLEQMMYDMYDHPDGLHKLMAFLRDGHLAKLDFLQEHGLLSLNNDSTYVGSGGFGWTDELPQADFNGKVRAQDMWGFCDSQETVQVSPKLFAEFVFPYQAPIMERFGINCYGCCEPLDKRWHVVKNFPNLRRVSVSPWAKIPNMAEMLEDQYIFSMKPSPTPLAMPVMNEELVRTSLREAIRATRNCRVEIIMKDNHTIGHNPNNVIRWCQIAQEEAARV